VQNRIRYIPNYLNDEEANKLLSSLCNNIQWVQRGKPPHKEPRLTYWYGKPYAYSSVSWSENEKWNEDLRDLRDRLNKDHSICNG